MLSSKQASEDVTLESLSLDDPTSSSSTPKKGFFSGMKASLSKWVPGSITSVGGVKLDAKAKKEMDDALEGMDFDVRF
ncbi:hypothetical protein HDU98_003529 [Podochytrium sp. JEL0797]|nr:hypothetical protein HDU98_003529 [Podochytrium sp. JEL0797]